MNIRFAFGGIMGICFGIAAVLWSQQLGSSLRAECGYIPHPISDVAWELYDRGKVPASTALYYTRMMRSENISAAECIEGRL